MKRKLLNLFLLGAVVLVSATMSSCKDYDDDIQVNTAQIQALQKNVSDLNSALQAAKTDLQNQLTAATADYTSKIAAAKADLQAAIDKKADATTVQKLASDLATLTTDYNAKVAALTAQLTSINTAIDGINATLALKVDKSVFDAAVQELKDQIALKANQTDLDKANALIADLTTRVKALEDDHVTVADFKALQDKVTSLEAIVGQNSTAIKALQDALDTKVNTADFDAFKNAYNDAVAAYTVWQGSVNDQLRALKNANDSITLWGARITVNELAIKDLQTQLAALDYVTPEELATALQGLEDKLSAADLKNFNDLSALIDAAKADLQAQLDAVKADVTANTNSIATLGTQLNALNDSIIAINEQLVTMTTLINRKLTSLVLKPAFYFGGIEAVEVPTLQDYASYTGQDTLTIDEVWAAEGNVVNISMGGVATYHVNPTIADLKGYTLDFYGNDPVTRAGIQYVNSDYTTFDALVAADPANFSEGLIHVPFTVDYQAVEATTEAGKTPMIAFQMTKNEGADGSRTVTSDYALLNISNYQDLIIADNATTGENEDLHVQQTAADLQHVHMFGQGEDQVVSELAPEAILPTHEIAYEDSLDLKKIVETHYTYTNTMAHTSSSDQLMDVSIFKALGLSYQFDLIPYTLTGRALAENTYVTLVNGVVTPNKDLMMTAKGHMPIVRVLLKDANGNVLKIGYIKLKVAGVTEPVLPEIFTGPKKVTCTGVAFDDVLVAKAEQDLYTDPRINMSQAQFAATYRLDVLPAPMSPSIVKQYVLNNDRFVAATTPIGIITSDGTKFTWALPTAVTDTMTVDANGANKYPFVTYLRYTNGGQLNAYLKMIIPVGAIVKPVPSMDNSNKVLARWYNENYNTQVGNGNALTEIHVNPQVVGQAGAADSIYYDMLNGFLGKTVQFTFPTTTFTNADVTDFQFVFKMKPGLNPGDEWIVYGRSGNSYTLTISADGTKLFAKTKTVATTSSYPAVTTDEEIATLSGAHNSVITYNTKAVSEYLAAYDILNKNGHKELADGQTFKAYIGVQAYICKWVDAGMFTVRFLRPVDLNTTSNEPAQDAVDTGYYVDLQNLFATPSDWRDQWADSYWNYYGISNIEADVTKAFTDAANPAPRTALSPGFSDQSAIESLATVQNANIEVVYIAPDPTHKFGQVLYTNNNATIKAFHIYVPIYVTYDWGYKVNMGYSRIDVATTLANAKRR